MSHFEPIWAILGLFCAILRPKTPQGLRPLGRQRPNLGNKRGLKALFAAKFGMLLGVLTVFSGPVTAVGSKGVKMAQNRPKMAQIGSKWLKMAQSAVKIGQNRSTLAQNCPKMAQNGPKMGPKWLKIGPKRALDPKTLPIIPSPPPWANL